MEIKRPEVSDEMIMNAANKIGLAVDGDPEVIADCYRPYMDGYDLAKKLEIDHWWEIDAQMVSDLDDMTFLVDREHEEACKKYFTENNIKPPFKVGDRIQQGEITGICERSAGRFLVKKPEQVAEDSSRLLVKFEDAVAV